MDDKERHAIVTSYPYVVGYENEFGALLCYSEDDGKSPKAYENWSGAVGKQAELNRKELANGTGIKWHVLERLYINQDSIKDYRMAVISESPKDRPKTTIIQVV